MEWIDLFKRIQKSKKELVIECSVEEVKIFHKELQPEGIFYRTIASSRQEADELISWLKHNT